MKLSKDLINKPVRYHGFDDVEYDGHIDQIRFADQYNTTMITVGYFIPRMGRYASARLDRAQFHERCTLI